MTATDYPQIFWRLITRQLAQVREAVQAETFVKSPHEQNKVLRLLTYALADTLAPAALPLIAALTPRMEQAGCNEQWRPCLERGIVLCQRQGDLVTEAALAMQLGVLLQHQSCFDAAVKHYTTALNNYERLDDGPGKANALNHLAHVAFLQHRYDEANTLITVATQFVGDDEILGAMTYFLKGQIATAFGRWAEAEALHRQALALRQQGGDERRVAWSLIDLGNTLVHQRSYVEAIACYEQSATSLQKLSDRYYWSHVQMNLGLAHYWQGEAVQAIVCYQAAKIEWEKYHDLQNLAKLYTNLGLAYLSLNRFRDAEESFVASIGAFQQLNDKSNELNATDGLAMALLAQGRYNDAIARLQQALPELKRISHLPAYDYLLNSMTNHLQEAMDAANGNH